MNKRGSTPGAGMKEVFHCNKQYDKIYETDKFFKIKNDNHVKWVIVDSGCPRSLMGENEFAELKENFKIIISIEIYKPYSEGL